MKMKRGELVMRSLAKRIKECGVRSGLIQVVWK